MSVCRVEQETFNYLCDRDDADREFEREWERAVGNMMGFTSRQAAFDALDAFQSEFEDGFGDGDEEKIEEISYKIFENECSIKEGLAEFQKYFENRF